MTAFEPWQELPYAAWNDTIETLHMKLQVIGKLRLALSPFEPQWANVPLYLSARGLTTTPMSASGQIVEVQVDLIDHQVVILTTAGDTQRVPLTARPVAEFYREFMAALRTLHIEVEISPLPSEVPNPIPFPEDLTHVAYDPIWATRFFRVLSQIDLVMKEHRARFRGKTSLVNFFWGSFDLALTRYSGRAVQPPLNAGIIERLGGDAEVICTGFWPGDARVPSPSLFGYAYPKPPGIEEERLRPPGARWDPAIGEFLLPYDDVRRASSPREAILEFCESVYAAGARVARWDPGLVIERPG
jgi:Family of unknown function (DUF5996)